MSRQRTRTHHENVLQVDVTLSVTLARQRLPLARVLELVPGMTLPLGKPHAEPLQLEASGRDIGRAEVVTLGDRFGVRIVELQRAA